jgi:vacuolar-type H+-ATPase subunit I/STV1
VETLSPMARFFAKYCSWVPETAEFVTPKLAFACSVAGGVVAGMLFFPRAVAENEGTESLNQDEPAPPSIPEPQPRKKTKKDEDRAARAQAKQFLEEWIRQEVAYARWLRTQPDPSDRRKRNAEIRKLQRLERSAEFQEALRKLPEDRRERVLQYLKDAENGNELFAKITINFFSEDHDLEALSIVVQGLVDRGLFE